MASSEPAAKIQDIQNDLQQLRSDVAQLAQQMASLFSATGEEALDQVKGRVRRMKDDVEGAVADAGERGREALDEVSETIGEAIETSLREHPLTTVALAVGLGFLFGTAWRRS
jgi:ElaB/YqjD/DUF883 family membrane-anchored ribosome-binding protein